jgi:DNA-binding protein HU-beta
MNKSELVDAVAEIAGSTKSNVEGVLNAFQDVIAAALQRGEKIVLTGFISLSVGDRAAREGRNPATGEPMQIAATKIVKIKAGNKLKEAVNLAD